MNQQAEALIKRRKRIEDKHKEEIKELLLLEDFYSKHQVAPTIIRDNTYFFSAYTKADIKSIVDCFTEKLKGLHYTTKTPNESYYYIDVSNHPLISGGIKDTTVYFRAIYENKEISVRISIADGLFEYGTRETTVPIERTDIKERVTVFNVRGVSVLERYGNSFTSYAKDKKEVEIVDRILFG